MCINAQIPVQDVLDGYPAGLNIFISISLIFLVFVFYQAGFFGPCRI